MSDSSSSTCCDHELVSSSLTIATLPLVLTRRRSRSLTEDFLGAEVRGLVCSSKWRMYSSCSADSLDRRGNTSNQQATAKSVPRIIVISPTSESSLVHQDCVDGQDGTEPGEEDVFVSLNFSSEVFEAVELLS